MALPVGAAVVKAMSSLRQCVFRYLITTREKRDYPTHYDPSLPNPCKKSEIPAERMVPLTAPCCRKC